MINSIEIAHNEAERRFSALVGLRLALSRLAVVLAGTFVLCAVAGGIWSTIVPTPPFMFLPILGFGLANLRLMMPAKVPAWCSRGSLSLDLWSDMMDPTLTPGEFSLRLLDTKHAAMRVMQAELDSATRAIKQSAWIAGGTVVVGVFANVLAYLMSSPAGG